MAETLTIYVIHKPLIGRKKVLLLRRAPNAYRQPGYEEVVGGTVEARENPKSAALRELREETGLGGFLLRLGLKHFRDYPYGQGNVNHVYYVIFKWRKPAIDLSQNPDSEHDGYRWAVISQVQQLAFRHLPIMRDLVEALGW